MTTPKNSVFITCRRNETKTLFRFLFVVMMSCSVVFYDLVKILCLLVSLAQEEELLQVILKTRR